MIEDIVVRAGDVTVTIPVAELQWRFSLSGGPGGQHVQKNSTRVELRWNVVVSPSISEDVRARLVGQLADRLSADGELRVFSAVGRSQYANRKRAAGHLADLVAGALEPDRPRHATAVPRTSRAERRGGKRHRSEVERGRRCAISRRNSRVWPFFWRG